VADNPKGRLQQRDKQGRCFEYIVQSTYWTVKVAIKVQIFPGPLKSRRRKNDPKQTSQRQTTEEKPRTDGRGASGVKFRYAPTVSGDGLLTMRYSWLNSMGRIPVLGMSNLLGRKNDSEEMGRFGESGGRTSPPLRTRVGEVLCVAVECNRLYGDAIVCFVHFSFGLVTV